MKETAESISTWATDTFGPAGSNARVAARANEEMAELLRKVTTVPDGEGQTAIAEECADVVIVLTRLASRCGYDLFAMVDRKMEINRQRVWKQDGSGHGYHVRDKSNAGQLLAACKGLLAHKQPHRTDCVCVVHEDARLAVKEAEGQS